ncbi:MAG: FHA domain-containing protein [Polyangiaceae bacterium]|nr:FHA domain-containing protein [Polyangiaceae bacterium]
MNCPFCSASIPHNSELCPHCMSDLRAASRRGDRGTATDGGEGAKYVPPRHGYVPPTQPGSASSGAIFASSGLAPQGPPTPPLPVAPAGPSPAPVGMPGEDVTSVSPYAPAPAAAPAPAGMPATAPPFVPNVGYQKGAPVGYVPGVGGVSPGGGYVPAPLAVNAGPFPRETAQAANPARRRTALDSDVAAPAPDAVARGRTRLDRNASGAPGAAAEPQRRVVGWMISFDVNESGQEYVIREGRNSVGRARDADISVFYDDLVSANHATIVSRNGELKLRDEMTNNGTFVNGQDIGPGETVPLKHGDVVRVGRCTFKLFILDPAEVAALWPHVSTPR